MHTAFKVMWCYGPSRRQATSYPVSASQGLPRGAPLLASSGRHQLCSACFPRPVTLLAPLPLKIAVDSVLGTRPFLTGCMRCHGRSRWFTAANGGLVICATLLVSIALLNCLQSLASWLLSTYTGEKLVHDFRGQLLFHAQRLSLSVHDRRGANDIAYRIQYDAPAIQNLLLQGMVPILSSAFTFVAMLLVTMRMSWHIASHRRDPFAGALCAGAQLQPQGAAALRRSPRAR